MEERRKFKRYSIYCPIQYRAENYGSINSSITLNMSEGGAMIVGERPIELTSSLIVKILLGNEYFFVRSKVVHVQRLQKDDPYNIGVEFLDRPRNFTNKFYEELEAVTLYQKHYSKEVGRDISLAEASMKWYETSPAWI